MNKARRAELNRIINAIQELKNDLEIVHDEEEEAMDNMPESLQDFDRYCAMEEAVDNMDNAIDELDDVIEYLESAME